MFNTDKRARKLWHLFSNQEQILAFLGIHGTVLVQRFSEIWDLHRKTGQFRSFQQTPLLQFLQTQNLGHFKDSLSSINGYHF